MTIGDIENACELRAGGGRVRIFRTGVRETVGHLMRLLESHFSSSIHLSVLGECPIACADVRSEASRTHASGGALVVDLANVSTFGCAAFREGADAFVESLADVTGEHGLVAIGFSRDLVSKVPDLNGTLDGWGDLPDGRELDLLERRQFDFDSRRRAACDCAQVVAEYLRCHPSVSQVWYPGLKGDPTHEVATRVLQSGFGPIVDFEARGTVALAPASPACLRRMPQELHRVVCWGEDPKELILVLEGALGPLSP